MIVNNYFVAGVLAAFALIALAASSIGSPYSIEKFFFDSSVQFTYQSNAHTGINDVKRSNPWALIELEGI